MRLRDAPGGRNSPYNREFGLFYAGSWGVGCRYNCKGRFPILAEQTVRKSFAPFSAEQIQPINEYQLGLSLSAGVGPLVCPHRDSTPHGDVGGRKGVLLASEAGLHCLYCGHTQNWVYSLMLRKNTLDFADKELVRWTEPRLIQLVAASLQERAMQAMGASPLYPYEAPDRLDALIEEAFRCLHRRQLAYFALPCALRRPRT